MATPPAAAQFVDESPATRVASTSPIDYEAQHAELGLASGWLPRGNTFEPFVADPRQPDMSANLHRYVDDDNIENAIVFGIGATAPFWRNSGGPWIMEAGAQAGVYSIFDKDLPSRDLLNADYYVSGYFAARRDRFSVTGRLVHISTHVGDEFLVANPDFERENFGFERVDVFVSQDFFGDYGSLDPRMRVYAGTGVTLKEPNPEDWGRWRFQWGIEGVGGQSVGPFRPVFGADVQHQEGRDFTPDISARVGLQLDSPHAAGSNIRLMFEYYNGREVNGQFWRDDLQYYGIGFHYLF